MKKGILLFVVFISVFFTNCERDTLEENNTNEEIFGTEKDEDIGGGGGSNPSGNEEL